MAPEGPALDLAIFRVTMALVIASSASVLVADEWAALPDAARAAPFGVRWLLPHVPIDPELVRIVRCVLYAACATGGIGLFSRASFAIVTGALFYVLLVPQLGGAVFHDHHLIWFAAVLAVSPSGDALSADAWIARKRGRPLPSRGRAHGAAVRVVWILIGLIFFFPGVHKLAESGLAWIFSDNLRNQLWWKWAMDPSLVPSWRIDRHPPLLHALAALTVIFELTFLPLVFSRYTRAIVVASALAFHQATDYFMGVSFSVLFACYTVFVPWDALWRRLTKKRAAPPERTRSVAPTAAMGTFLVIAVSAFGAAGMTQAYPFACYPTFQWIPSDRLPALAIDVEREDGSIRSLSRDDFIEPGPRGWALQWRLVGVYDRVDRARLIAWWEREASREPLRSEIEGARSIRFYRVEVSVDPDRDREELTRREILRLD